MDKWDFKNDAVEMRVDVTLLREGLNCIRGLCAQIIDNEDASVDDYKTLAMQIEELCGKTLWKESEAIDSGFVPQGGWMPQGPPVEIEVLEEKDT